MNEDKLYDLYPSFMSRLDHITSQVYVVFNTFGWTWTSMDVTHENIRENILSLLTRARSNLVTRPQDQPAQVSSGRIMVEVETSWPEPQVEVFIQI